MLSRRELLAKCIALGVVTSATSLNAFALFDGWEKSGRPRPATSPSQLGPFYKREAPNQAQLRAPQDPGLPLKVSGRVFDTRGNDLPGAKVEVWQTDHLGHYDLTGYRYRAALASDSKAGYEFSSVMPGHYPARVCQHIHYMVTAPGHKPLVTQLYFATDPVFEGDPDRNYTRDPLIWSRELVRPVALVGDPKDVLAAVNFDVVLEAL